MGHLAPVGLECLDKVNLAASWKSLTHAGRHCHSVKVLICMDHPHFQINISQVIRKICPKIVLMLRTKNKIDHMMDES